MLLLLLLIFWHHMESLSYWVLQQVKFY